MKAFYKSMHSKKGSSGFTLIELLIVIAIIGILAGISIPMFLGQRTKAMVQEAEANLKQLYLLEQQYYAEHGVYGPNDTPPIYPKYYIYEGTYGVGTGGIEDQFKGFKPGAVEDLNFKYTIGIAKMAGHVGPYEDGQFFGLYAKGKVGTAVEGILLILNQDNEYVTLP